MDSPPQLERNDLFASIGAVFRAHQMPVAEIIAEDQTNGLFLLTDLGDVHFESLYDTPLEEPALQAAIELLPKLGAIQDPAIAPYTTQRLYDELEIFSEWFMGRMLGLEIYVGTFQDVSRALVDAIDKQPKCCVHRDYHCRNLLFTNGQLGLVDFQDALHGPLLYDVASLLRDCYHTFSEANINRWLDTFIAQNQVLQDMPRDEVKQWFDWTAIQRQLKAVGIFARMYLRDDKSTHLGYILPVLERLYTLVGLYPELRSMQTQLIGCMEAYKPYLAKHL
jgi:N-acetylmuramate 1-kinase